MLGLTVRLAMWEDFDVTLLDALAVFLRNDEAVNHSSPMMGNFLRAISTRFIGCRSLPMHNVSCCEASDSAAEAKNAEDNLGPRNACPLKGKDGISVIRTTCISFA